MEHTKNNIPIYAEEIIIEQTAEEEIAELKEQLKVLQEEKEKKDLKTKLNDSKTKLLGSLFGNKKKSEKIDSLKNRMSKLEVNKDQQIDNLKEQLKQEKERADDLQAELNREKDSFRVLYYERRGMLAFLNEKLHKEENEN
ncbi:8986_t:CDS:2, partial [Funneliformis geosporum]